MPEEEKVSVGVEVEQNPEGPFDVLHFSIPLPKFVRMPDEAEEHWRASRRERLLALRGILDEAIKETEKPKRSQRRVERVRVEGSETTGQA
jgi:hypothetical protein